jgi:hypothetical protein
MAPLTPVALALALAGCLSEPQRPHGIGAPIAANSILRHQVVVGDLDNDGYDDLIVWGNEVEIGANPTVFIYWGGETFENPDVRLDVTVNDPDGQYYPYAVFELTSVSLFVSADGTERGLAVVSCEQRQPEHPNPTQVQRDVYLSYYRANGRTIAPRERSRAVGYGDLGGYVDASSPAFVLVRDPTVTPPLREYATGADNLWTFTGPLEPNELSSDGYWNILGNETTHFMQGVTALPPKPGLASEDLLLVTEEFAYRITSDGPAYTSDGHPAQLPGRSDRSVRFGRVGDRTYAVMDTGFDFGQTVPIVETPIDGEPVVYEMTDKSAHKPTDLVIGDVDGNASVDVVTLEGQVLAVYRDLALSDDSTYTLVSSRESQGSYDLLALGNFHGDDRREVYELDSADPTQIPKCYRVDGTTLAACERE